VIFPSVKLLGCFHVSKTERVLEVAESWRGAVEEDVAKNITLDGFNT
jgi:hypothetical protein